MNSPARNRRQTLKHTANVDWDFRECPNFPEWQLPYCYEYEFARASDRIREWCERSFKSEVIAGYYRPLRESVLSRDIDPFLLHTLHMFPEFPDTPFLAIPEAERTKRLRLWTGPRRMAGDHREYNLDGGKLVPYSGMGGNVSKLRVTEKDPQDAHYFDMGIEYRDHKTYIEHGYPVTYTVVRIPWASSPEWLSESFRRFVAELRPSFLKDFGVPSSPSERGKRGKTGERNLLKALGAKRLVDRHGWVKAGLITQGIWTNEKGIRGPMFEGRTSWLDARKRARDHIDHFQKSRLRSVVE